ncbi:MAG: DNA repair protein RecO [Gemmatimonadaceae bacterium]
MSLLVTQAMVLHAFDYLETSRVLRLLTRESGLQSVLAKGARRTRGRVGTGVDLFAEGEAQLYVKPTRDLQTLASFDVSRSRTALALDMRRFTAASAIAELVLRIAGDEPNPALFDSVSSSLDDIALATDDAIVARALAGAWRVVAAAGFAPALDDCANCHTPVPSDDAVSFSHPAGGALCAGCGRLAATARKLPADARGLLRGWLADADAVHIEVPVEVQPMDPASARAHQRLLREFLREHLSDDRPLRAFAAWETGFGSSAEPVQ